MRYALLLVLAGCPGSSAPPPVEPAPPAATPDAPAATTAPPIASDPFLSAHNLERAKNCAPALAWSDELAAVAQAWAETLKRRGCVLEHSASRYGENLAAATEGTLDPAAVTALWYDEIATYDFKHPGFSPATGHFTQLVWASTRQLGCGSVTCNGLDLWVCNYDPAGNVEGGYAANVKPPTCR